MSLLREAKRAKLIDKHIAAEAEVKGESLIKVGLKKIAKKLKAKKS